METYRKVQYISQKIWNINFQYFVFFLQSNFVGDLELVVFAKSQLILAYFKRKTEILRQTNVSKIRPDTFTETLFGELSQRPSKLFKEKFSDVVW